MWLLSRLLWGPAAYGKPPTQAAEKKY